MRKLSLEPENAAVVIAMRQKGLTYKVISEATKIPKFRVEHIWRAFKGEKLGLHHDTESQISALEEKGLSAYDIAATLGCSVSLVRTIQYRKRASGVAAPKEIPEISERRGRRTVSSRDYEVWRRMKTGEKVSVISEEHGVTRARIYQIFSDVEARLHHYAKRDSLDEDKKRIMRAAERYAPLSEVE